MTRTYAMLDEELAHDGWAGGGGFSLADCAAAPALFYSNMAVPFAGYPHLSAYFERLRARPSFARVVDEARPYRHLFPLPWPAGYD
jgi:glutathione S-transferase